jgi:NAD(P)-dependent dehydrogenase (short-subunit alcohol dehydrogenase family)
LGIIDMEGAEATGAALRAAGTTVEAIEWDVGAPQQLGAGLRDVDQRYSGIIILHSNGGIASGASAWPDLALDRAARVIAANRGGVIYGTIVGDGVMRKRGVRGAIVHTASVSGLAPMASSGDAVYAACKARGIMRSVGIRVKAVCSPLTDTPIVAPARSGGRDAAPSRYSGYRQSCRSGRRTRSPGLLCCRAKLTHARRCGDSLARINLWPTVYVRKGG